MDVRLLVCVLVRFGVFVVFVGVSVFVCDRDVYGFGGVDDSILIVGVNGGEGAEEQAVDIRQDGGAARRDAVLSQKLVQVAESVVDALGGLEALGIPNERSVDIGGLFLFFQGEMVGTDTGVRVRDEATALTPVGVVMAAAMRE